MMAAVSKNAANGGKARKEQRRYGIIVLGMHRSGTSALTRMLSLLGCDLPKTLIGANKTNESGHWEAEPVARLNDRILESAGSNWHDWAEFNPGWFSSPKADEFRQEAIDALEQEFGSSRLLVLKDPRICRLLPFWAEAMEESGRQPLVVSPIRNPLEVAASLERRNGFDPSLAHLMWLRNVLDAEFASRGMPRFFTSYDAVMGGWGRVAEQAQSALGISWPRLSNQAAVEIEGFLSDRLRHHRESVESVTRNPILSSWLRDSYEIIENWTRSGKEKKDDLAALDTIRTEFNAASPAFARLISAGQENAQKARSLQGNLAETQARLGQSTAASNEHQEKAAKLAQDLASAQRDKAATQAQVAQLQSDLQKRSEEVQAAERARAEAREKWSQLEKSTNEQKEKVAGLSHELSSVQKDRAAAQARLTQLQADLERSANEQKERLAGLNQELASVQNEKASAQARLTQLQADLERSTNEQKERVAGLSHELASMQNEKAAAQARLVQLQGDLERSTNEQREKIAGLSHELAVSQNDKAAVQAQLAKAQSELQTRAAESQAAERSLSEAHEKLGLFEKSANEHKERVAGLSHELGVAQNERAAAQAQLAQLRSELQQRAQEAQSAERSRTEAAEKLALFQKTSNDHQEKAARLNVDLASVQRDKLAAEAELAALKADLQKRAVEAQAAERARLETQERLGLLDKSSGEQMERLASLSHELAAAKEQRAAAQAQLQQLQAEVQRRAADAQSAKNALATLQDRLSEAEEARKDQQELVQRLDHQLATAMQEKAASNEQAVRLQVELQKRAAEAEALAAAHAEGRAKLDHTEAALRDQELRAGQSEERLGSAQQRLEDSERNVVALQAELARRAEELQAALLARAEAERRGRELEAASARQEDRTRSLEAEVASLRRDMARSEEQLAGLHGQLARKSSEITESTVALAERHATLEGKQREIALLVETVEALREDIDSQTGQALEARAALAELRHKLAQTESALAQRRHESEETAAELSQARDKLRTLAASQAEGEKLADGFREHITLLMSDLREKQSQLAEMESASRGLAAEKDIALATAQKFVEDHLARNAANQDAMARVEAHQREIESLRRDLVEANARTESIHLERAAEIRIARNEVDQARIDRRTLEKSLKDRFDEITALTSMIASTQKKADRSEEVMTQMRLAAARHLGQAVSALLDGNRWRLLPQRFRLKRQMELLNRTGLFDAKWYVGHYNDIANTGVDPLRHYIEHGAKEGREPNAMLAELRSAAAGEDTPRS